jgi:Lamin Tail Domain
LDSLTLVLTIDEPVDSAKAAIAANYNISDGVGSPLNAVVLPPTFTQVRLMLSTPLSASKVYTVTAVDIVDCSGNIIQAANTTKVGLASVIDTADVIINEILFNPKPTAVDYVEIYNRSNKVSNLKDVYIANRSSGTSSLGSIRQLTTENILIFPGDFFVISENGTVVKQNYAAKNPGNFIDVTMPSLPDDEGVFVLLNAQGQVVDELRYSSKWHFALIDNEEGISLERIDYNKQTQNKDNWTSAASTAGFGTPSYQNSQLRADVTLQGEMSITPKTFSPDNDGFEDYAIINIKMADPGYVANITIFDATGRPVRELAKNATLAASASFRWDGLDDKFRKVPVGIYVVYTEVFNLNGRKKSFKNTVVVAARF